MRYLLATVFSVLIICFGFSQNTKSTFCNQKIEVCFLIDATGSMRPVMEDFKTSIPEVLRDMKIDWSGWDLEIRAVLYRDQQDEYLTRTFEKTTNLNSFVDFMQKQYAVGGGDEQEQAEIICRTIAQHHHRNAIERNHEEEDDAGNVSNSYCYYWDQVVMEIMRLHPCGC